MQIAVPSMEDVGDLEAMLLADRRDPDQHLRQAAERDGAVHAEIVRDPADGAEGRLAAFPDGSALRLAFD